MKGLLTLAGGLAIAAVGVVLLRKASKKTDDIVREHQEMVEVIENCVSDEYSEEDRENDYNINNAQTLVKLVKNYAVPMLCTIVGGCMSINGGINMYRSKNGMVEDGVFQEC